MDHIAGFGDTSGHFAAISARGMERDNEELPPLNECSEPRSEIVRALLGGVPRLFALIRDEGDDKPAMRVIALGVSLPHGGAATVGMDGHGFGRWGSVQRAAFGLGCEYVWLGGA
ncbi:hypothetical protein Sme01_29920 [Sphaerisporangium melleum]|uniref:Uncharacterized protein n=1 Tax=Sphaerisporangium melleum TaxID=321316 RepID=A0A917VI19_9ACTN|nr:hypothetical protein [Sphaerisporangium melleum]GGK85239.1 hypothetical protein GCM10007964_29700 [Sphaerisporangium melleum]GII70516.1 hypothetical protein Sme01_29920 [Sphaerisporangium melleum]